MVSRLSSAKEVGHLSPPPPLRAPKSVFFGKCGADFFPQSLEQHLSDLVWLDLCVGRAVALGGSAWLVSI